jgi:5-methylcytosine-specific restriction endonuclease McrA
MARRQREWAKRARAALIAQMGGVCERCGSREDLEVNHIFGRDWQLRDYDPSGRVAVYRREFREGLINVLCSGCNGSDGALVQRPRYLRTGATQ